MTAAIALRRAVLSRLNAEATVSAAPIGVRANARQVILSGQIASNAQQGAAPVAARGVRGGEGVGDDIRVAVPVPVYSQEVQA